VTQNKSNLVGGFNPFEQYWSKWKSSPNKGENKKIFEPHHPEIILK